MFYFIQTSLEIYVFILFTHTLLKVFFYGIGFMKKVKYRNNNYNNQVYSINYKFDSVSPAGKVCGTALDLIKKYNELAKEAHANGNYVEAEVFRQYAEHYRKIITEINERKNIRFNSKEPSQNSDENASEVSENDTTEIAEKDTTQEKSAIESAIEKENTTKENSLIETKVKPVKKSFKIVEVSESSTKTKKTVKPRVKKSETTAVNE